MSWLSAPEFKVGILVIVVGLVIGGMAMRVSEDPSYLSGGSNHYWFVVDDATGIVTNSVVKLAGVSVGVIKKITLREGRARLDLSIQSHLPVTTSSSVRIKALGFLGDKHVELILGDTSLPRLASGSQIHDATDGGSMDVILDEVTKISQSLGDISSALREAAVGEGTDKHPLGRILRNIENLTEDLSSVVGRNKENMDEILSGFASLSRKLNEIVGDDEDEGLRAAIKDASAGMKRIESMMANLEEVSTKINNGDGTLGRLINDDELIEEVNETVKGVNNLLSAAKKLETSLDVHSEYLGDVGEAKSYLGVRLQPGPDRYYEFAIVDDPKGVIETEEQTISGTTTAATTTVTTFKNKTKFSAIFAKNFYDFTLKGGLFENEGGVGMDYHFFNKSLRLSIEGFDFADLHLRSFARYDLWKGIYLIAGGDDIADADNSSAFFGAGLFLTNDDLKFLLTRAPF